MPRYGIVDGFGRLALAGLIVTEGCLRAFPARHDAVEACPHSYVGDYGVRG
jgi:hypothetical protein